MKPLSIRNCFHHVPIFSDEQRNELSTSEGLDSDVIEALRHTRMNMAQLAQAQALEEVPNPSLRNALQATLRSFINNNTESSVIEDVDMDGEDRTGDELHRQGSSTDSVPRDLAHSYEKALGGMPSLCQYIDDLESNELFMSYFPRTSINDASPSGTFASEDDDDNEDYFPGCQSGRLAVDENGFPFPGQAMAKALRNRHYDNWVTPLLSSDASDTDVIEIEDDSDGNDADNDAMDDIPDPELIYDNMMAIVLFLKRRGYAVEACRIELLAEATIDPTVDYIDPAYMDMYFRVQREIEQGQREQRLEDERIQARFPDVQFSIQRLG